MVADGVVQFGKQLRVVLAQAELVWQNPAANFVSFQRLIDEYQAPADLFVLPEMFCSGFTMTPQALPSSVGKQSLEWMQQCGVAHDAAMCASTPYRLLPNGDFVNRMLLARPNGHTTHYDKRHRFAMAGEHAAYAAGSAQPVVAKLGEWRILLQVCYDLRFPVYSRNRPGAGEYDLVVFVANWPATRREHWRVLLQARAIENQAYVIGVNRIGSDANGLEYAGDTLCFDPLGEMLIDAGSQPGLFAAELSLDHVRDVRERLPFARDADAFTLD